MQRPTDTRSKQPAISFRHLCHLERPTSWPVSQLYGEIMNPASTLQALYNALVTDITVCQRYGLGVRAVVNLQETLQNVQNDMLKSTPIFSLFCHRTSFTNT